jgi:antitoxin component HigA of HigAB toxin-antitoxin module
MDENLRRSMLIEFTKTCIAGYPADAVVAHVYDVIARIEKAEEKRDYTTALGCVDGILRQIENVESERSWKSLYPICASMAQILAPSHMPELLGLALSYGQAMKGQSEASMSSDVLTKVRAVTLDTRKKIHAVLGITEAAA